MHPALLAHQSAWDLSAADRSFLFEPEHVVHKRQANRLWLVVPEQLSLANDVFFVARFLNQCDLEFDLDRLFGNGSHRLRLVLTVGPLPFEKIRVAEQGIGQVGHAHLLDAPLDLRTQELFEPSIHGREVGAHVVIEALAPFLAPLVDGQTKESLLGRWRSRCDKLMRDAQDAFEEIRAIDRLAKNDFFPTCMELGVLLDVSAMELEELLILFVPVRPTLAGFEVFEVLAPSFDEHFGVGAVVLEKVDRGFGQPLLALTRLFENEVDAVLFPFKLGNIPGDGVVPQRRVDKGLQGRLRSRVDGCAVLNQALPHLLRVDGLTIGALLGQQRSSLREELLECLAPRANRLAVSLGAGKERRISRQTHVRQRPADRVADGQAPRGVRCLADLGAKLAKLDER